MYEYNIDLVNKNISNLKHKCNKIKEKPSIWFDMDNTLYKFSTYKMEQHALDHYYDKGYYKNLQIYPEAPDVIEALQRMGFNVGIQSAYIDSPYCKSEKLQSLEYHFPMIPKENIILEPVGEDKIGKIPNIDYSIIIDDYHGNLERVYELGGVGVKKSYSLKQRKIPVIHSLVEIFPILMDLGCLK